MMYHDISSALLGRHSTAMYIYTSAVYCVHCKLYTVHRASVRFLFPVVFKHLCGVDVGNDGGGGGGWRNLINLGFLILLSTIF